MKRDFFFNFCYRRKLFSIYFLILLKKLEQFFSYIRTKNVFSHFLLFMMINFFNSADLQGIFWLGSILNKQRISLEETVWLSERALSLQTSAELLYCLRVFSQQDRLFQLYLYQNFHLYDFPIWYLRNFLWTVFSPLDVRHCMTFTRINLQWKVVKI